MERSGENIEWVENQYPKTDFIIGVIFTFVLIGIWMFSLLMFPFNPIIFLIISLSALAGPVAWFYASKRNITKRVGFSKNGVYFRYSGKDRFVLWGDIESIVIQDSVMFRKLFRLRTGETWILGFIDDSLIYEMIRRKEEFDRSTSSR
jgi:hypothetical protein